MMINFNSAAMLYQPERPDISCLVFAPECQKALTHGKLIETACTATEEQKKKTYENQCAIVSSLSTLTFHATDLMNIYCNRPSTLSVLPKELIAHIVNLIVEVPFPTYEVFKDKFISSQPLSWREQALLSLEKIRAGRLS